MCFSAQSSAYNFIFGIVCSFLLIKYGNKKYSENNLIYGYFFIYIVFMQLFDLIFWLNQNPNSKINNIFTHIAALFVYTQPTMLYLLKVLIQKPNFNNNIDKFYLLINLFYLYVVYEYYSNFIKDKPIITLKKGNHLRWKLTQNNSYFLYFILFALNIFYLVESLSDIKYAIIVFILIFGSLLISSKLFEGYIGELWCYIATASPIFLLILGYLI